MTQEVFRLGNLLIAEGKFCFDTIDQVMHLLESVIRNGGAKIDLAGRISAVGMRGIGKFSLSKVHVFYINLI